MLAEFFSVRDLRCMALTFVMLGSFPALAASEDYASYLEEIRKVTQRINGELDGKEILERIHILDQWISEYSSNSAVVDMLLQLKGTEFAFANQHQKALTTFDLHRSSRAPLRDEVTALSVQSAVDSILEAAVDKQVVMINEAHHVPQHRVLTYRLLEPLWQQGYRYFAAEGFSSMAESDVRRDYVSKSYGYYTQESIFANLILHAKELGFKIISYDQGTGSQEERELSAASNIGRKIFANDPNAKVILHVGYGHINEQSWLAYYLKQSLNLDPLTVDQTSISEKSASKYEPETYEWITSRFEFNEPIVLVGNDGLIWSSSFESYDISVIWPRTTYEFGRPNWASLSRKPFLVDIAWCDEQYPCMIEVFRSATEDEVALDRVVIEAPDQKAEIFLSKGKNVIVVTNLENKRLHSESIEL